MRTVCSAFRVFTLVRYIKIELRLYGITVPSRKFEKASFSVLNDLSSRRYSVVIPQGMHYARTQAANLCLRRSKAVSKGLAVRSGANAIQALP